MSNKSPTNIPDNSEARKGYPIYTGVFAYFPAAIAYVAKISKTGEKHHPGQPLHWERAKSRDHADCCARHLIESGTKDNNGIRHSGMLAWRALALLQEELEREEGAPKPPNAVDRVGDKLFPAMYGGVGAIGPEGDNFTAGGVGANGPSEPKEDLVSDSWSEDKGHLTNVRVRYNYTKRYYEIQARDGAWRWYKAGTT